MEECCYNSSHDSVPKVWVIPLTWRRRLVQEKEMCESMSSVPAVISVYTSVLSMLVSCPYLFVSEYSKVSSQAYIVHASSCNNYFDVKYTSAYVLKFIVSDTSVWIHAV